MRLTDFGLLTDENIDPDVVRFLRDRGFDVSDVRETGRQGAADADLLESAAQENRVVVTHDADFGTLAVHEGSPVVGIVYLRPGHIDPEFTIDTIREVLGADIDVVAPFLIVARHTGSQVAIRYRPLAP